MSYSRAGRGFTKPPPGSLINWGHPLAQGLAEVIIYNEGSGRNAYSLLYGEKMTLAQGTEVGLWSSGNHGIRRQFNTHCDTLPNTPRRNLLGAMTLHVGLEPTSATGESAYREIVNRRANGAVGTGIEYGLYHNNSVGISFYWATASAFQQAVILGSGLMPQYQFCTLTGTRSPDATAGKLYRNEVLLKSTTGLTPPTLSGQTFNVGSDTDFTDPLLGNIYYIYLWNRELSATDIQWLNEEPYAFIQPVPYRRYKSFVSAFILASASNSNYVVGGVQ